jgi:hypothetical protein
MPSRITREERFAWELRLEATQKGIARLTRSTAEIAFLAGIAGALLEADSGDLGKIAESAGLAALFSMLVVTTFVFLATVVFVVYQSRAGEQGTQYLRYEANRRRALPEGVDQYRVWRFLVAVARERVALSQEGAAEFGISARASNELKEWLAAVGWWEWVNRANYTGRWTAEGDRVLELLKQEPAPVWNDLIEAL